MEDAVYFGQVMSEYERAIDPGLMEFIELVRSAPEDHANKFGYSVSVVGERQRADTERLLGEEIRAQANYIKGDRVHHIDHRHGKNGVADHSMAEIEDMARIGYVLANYDNLDFLRNKNGDIKTNSAYTARNGRPAPVIIYVIRVNGFHSVVEAINDGKSGRLNIISSYKSSVNPIEINKARMPNATAN